MADLSRMESEQAGPTSQEIVGANLDLVAPRKVQDQVQADSFNFHSVMANSNGQSQQAEVSRLRPAQALALSSSEQQAASLVTKPELLSKWVDAYLAVSKKDARLASSLEKFVFPALRNEILLGREPGTDEDKRRFVQTLSELSRLKEFNSKIGSQVLSNEEFLQIAAVNGMRIPHSVFERWYKKNADADLAFALSWIQERLNSQENQDGRISSLATLIPHKSARQLYLDHKATSPSGLETNDLGNAVFGMEPKDVSEIVDLNLSRFPKRDEALASVLLSMPAKAVNKYLDEVDKSKSALYLGPLGHLQSGFSAPPQEGLDRKRIVRIFSDIQAHTLERTRRLINENQKPVYEELRSLLRSPQFSDRQTYLSYQAKAGQVDGWTFTEASEGLNTEEQLKLLDTYTSSLEFGKKEAGLEALREMSLVKRSLKLQDAVEKTLQALKQGQEKELALLLEVPEPDIENLNSWRPKDGLLKFKGTEVVQATRLRDNVRPPLGGWKYKEGQFSDLLDQVSEPYLKDVNVYSFMHGKQEVELRVDKSFDEEMRKAGGNKDGNGRVRILPEELASLVIETIPATGHIRVIELKKLPEPERYVHPENPPPGHNPTTEAAADALIEGGRIRFYNNYKYGFISVLKHEYKHLLQKEPGFKTYQQATKFESTKWQGNDYGYTNDMEDWAVNGGERALGKDSARFVQFVRQAPARALASLAVIDQVQKKADSLDEGQRKAFLKRIEFGESEALPRFQKEMEASLSGKDYARLKQQFIFLAHLATDSDKPSWAAKVLESSEPLKKLFSEPSSDPELRKQLLENLVQLSAILEDKQKNKDNIYADALRREIPVLRAEFLELAASTGNGERKAQIRELAASIRSRNSARALELVSDAEFVKIIGKDYLGLRGLDGWYQAARREGKESEVLDLISAKGENAILLLGINDLKARLKYADGSENLSKYDLRWLLLNLDNDIRVKFLESSIQKFPDREEALNYALSELPPAWQLKQLEVLARTKPPSALESLKAVIDRGANNDLEVLRSAQALYLSLKKSIPADIYKKLDSDLRLSYDELTALSHDNSLESRALSLLLGFNLSSLSKGLNNPDRAQLLALFIAQHRLDKPGQLFEALSGSPAYKLDSNYRYVVDKTLMPAGKNEAPANDLLAGRILQGEALKAYFRSKDAQLAKPDVPANMIRIAKALDPDGKQTEAAVQELLYSLKSKVTDALSTTERVEKERNLRAILGVVQKLWQFDPKLGSRTISMLEAVQALPTESYRIRELAREWFRLAEKTQEQEKVKTWLREKIAKTNNSYEQSRLAELFFEFSDLESRKEGLALQKKYYGSVHPASVAEALKDMEENHAREILTWQLKENPSKKVEILADAFTTAPEKLQAEILEQLKDARSAKVAVRMREVAGLASPGLHESIMSVYRKNFSDAIQEIDRKSSELSLDELELLTFSDELRHRLRHLKEARIDRVRPSLLLQGLSEASKKEVFLEYLKKAPKEDRERAMQNPELSRLLR